LSTTSPIALGTAGNSTALSIAFSGGSLYVAGQDFLSTSNVAVYWKDGVEHVLSNTSSVASSISVSGNAVFAAGIEGASAVYWNGSTKTILAGTTGANPNISIFVQ
jgi:hypothetical protein